jgi:hypothetical protein
MWAILQRARAKRKSLSIPLALVHATERAPETYAHLDIFSHKHRPIKIYGQMLAKLSHFDPNTSLFTNAIADILLVHHGLKQEFTPDNREIQCRKRITLQSSKGQHGICRLWSAGHDVLRSQTMASMKPARQSWQIACAHDEDKATKGCSSSKQVGHSPSSG